MLMHPPKMTVYRGDKPMKSDLTPLEFSTLKELCRAGGSNKNMAAAMDVDEETIKSRLRIVFLKMRVTTRTAAILKAFRTGLVDVNG